MKRDVGIENEVQHGLLAPPPTLARRSQQGAESSEVQIPQRLARHTRNLNLLIDRLLREIHSDAG